MKHKFTNAIALLLFVGLSLNLAAQKETPPSGYDNLPKLSPEDSIGLVNLPELVLPDDLKGPNALILPYIVDNSAQEYWRPVFEQVQFECGQASGVGLGFTYAINRMRDLPSDVEDNQYPTHFVWNFGNGGNGWYGVSYFHSFEIIKREGTPDVIDFGGMTGTGPEMWMTGYDKYYNAMHNRIADVYKIDLTTVEGINTLRNWIHNHLDGSEIGGIANFYTNAPYGMPTLPSGTPEAGQYVVTGWSYANHGLTISGYHDSICWDYNSDGQYTNDIDLNGDGEITPRDWEIGGFRFANTYSGGPSWGNNGFSYMTYKSCADPYGNGGIWDNAAHVIYAKGGTEPLLTAKIGIKYNCRNRLRVQVGMSTDIDSETPDYVLGFPLFNFQGGCQYMQGGTSSEDKKTIEFGLDITPLLNLIEPGTPARYFLILTEDDPEGWAWGQMLNFSIIDYTDGVEEIICEESNVSINNNDKTLFWVNHEVAHEPVEISTEELTPATVYEPYDEQLEAQGGAEPYTWSYDMNYTETTTTAPFPMVDDEQLLAGGTTSPYATKTLGFTFPFYGHEFDQVRVNVDGYISFEEMFDWPYQVYDFFHFTKNKLISPFQANLNLYSSNNDGIWYEGDENSATFRWKASANGAASTSELNFAVQLFSNGDIRFYYGETNEYPAIDWISGLSSGDNIFYQFTEVTNDPEIPADLELNLEATRYPEGFTVSRAGEMTGTATQVYDGLDVKFLVTDENNLTASKVLPFSTDGSNYLVIKNVFVNSGGDEVIEYGETAELTVEIESLGVETIFGAEMAITSTGEFTTLIDSVEVLGDFEPGEIKSFETAFSFEVDSSVPDGEELDFPSLITDNSGSDWASHIYLTAYAPDINVSSVIIDDGSSGGLDPGETADMIVVVHNNGGAKALDVEAVLSSSDPYITINDNASGLSQLGSGASGNLVFNVTASEDTPPAYIIEFDVDMTAANGYATSGEAYVACGLLMEGFESGDFASYPWSMSGNNEWYIDDNVYYEGLYAARSGDISDNQTSTLELEIFVLSDGEISFYKKVSSEASYDFLKFYIDGIQKDQWAGEDGWSMVSFPITAGLHTFRWSYEKDFSVSTGSDCAWVDNIILPPFGDQDPQILYTPSNFLVTVTENTVVQDTLSIYNIGTGPVMYTITDADTSGNSVDWLTIDNPAGGINPGNGKDVILLFDGSELSTGLYETTVTITDHIDNTYDIPVYFHVDLAIGFAENDEIKGVKAVPNPFSGQTVIEFSLAEEMVVNVDVFDANGEQLATLARDSELSAGLHRVHWKATDDQGKRLNNGLYFYRITGRDLVISGKLILID
jgi:hypothetical protein